MLMQCLHAINPEHGLIISLFLAGIAGGFSHCVTMCGPFVLAQSSQADNFGYRKLVGMTLLPYHLGRMTTYIAMAVLLNTVLNVAFLFMPVKSFIVAPILFLTGIVFLASVFPQISVLFPWVGSIKLSLPFRFLSSLISPLLQSPSPVRRYALGIVLGFMPCGLVISALMATSMATTPVEAALAMGSFAIGTMPSLIILAYGGATLRQRYPSTYNKLQGGMMLVSGLWLCALAGLMIF